MEQRLAKGLDLIDAKVDYLLGEGEYQKWLLSELGEHFGKLLGQHLGTKVRAEIQIYEIPGLKGG